jgi:hypothetical protein
MRLLMATVAALALALAGTAPAAQTPAQPAALLADLRAPDQQVLLAEAEAGISDLRAPDQQAPGPAKAVSGGRRTANVYGLIGLSGVLVALAGLGTRFRHRAAVAHHPPAR